MARKHYQQTHFVMPKTHSMDPEAVIGALAAVYGQPAVKTVRSVKFVTDDGMEIFALPYKTGKTIIDVFKIPLGSETYESFLRMFSAWRAHSKEPDNAATPPRQKKLRKRHRHLRGTRAVRDRHAA